MKTKAGDLKYRELEFQLEEFPGCCGIGVVKSFREKDPYIYESIRSWRDADKKAVPFKFATMREQAEDCYKRMLQYNSKYSEDYTTLCIALVSNYSSGPNKGEPQLPALHDLLIENDWQINQVFINPNHGNEVTLFSKHFPEKVAEYYDEDEDELV